MSDRIRKGHLRQRIHIHIEGIVQGVGFRPFLHRLAEEHGICGYLRMGAQHFRRTRGHPRRGDTGTRPLPDGT